LQIVVTAYGVLCQSGMSILMGIGIPLYFAPRLTGYSLLLVPIVLIASFLNGWLAKVQERKASETMDEISKLVLEVFQNKHVVTTCQLESYFIDKLKLTLKKSGK
jgi:ABC-type bacteriocin/lantibiotic exporter with double-glycine peptidase domain